MRNAARERRVGGVAAPNEARRTRELRSCRVVRVHEDKHVQLLGLGPERVEVLAVVVAVIHVGRNVSAAKIERVIACSRIRPSRSGSCIGTAAIAVKRSGLFFETFFDALVVDAAPALRLFAFELVAEPLRARIEHSQRDFAFPIISRRGSFVRQALQQRIPRPAVERNRIVPSLSSETSMPSALPCRFASPITSPGT